MRYGLRLFAAAIVALAPLSTAEAVGLFRAYLSAASGNDANDCTLGRPCRLLPKALAAVADGGEVWIVDSGNFNTAQVNIDKSVTILAVPSAQGSLVATGGSDALFVNTAGVRVTLRHLVVVPFGGAVDGVGFAQGAELNVFDCDISGMQGSGIAAYDAAAKVTVSGTTVRGNGNGIYTRGSIVASLDHVQSLGNTYGVFADAGSVITVTNSVIAHNASVGGIAQSGAEGAQLVVRGSSIVDQPQGLFASGNNTAKAVVITSANTLVKNQTPFAFAGSLATIVTMQNNDAAFYTNLTTPGYSLTPNGSAI